MRLLPLLLTALLAFATPATAAEPQNDAAKQVALDRADVLEGEQRFAEIPPLLAPWKNTGDAAVDYTIAYALFNATLNGRRPEDIAKGELDEVVRLAEGAAAAGHAGGANLLYLIWATGYDRPVDMPKAMQWLRQAVDGGDVGAKASLATMLYEGRPWLERDRGRACGMLVEFMDVDGAAMIAMYYLGLATMRGECGLHDDDAKGADMIRRAAEAGLPDAERDYGRILEDGVGTDEDDTEALRWFERAAESGDGFALWRLGMAHVEGTGGRELDPVRAVSYFERAIANDSGDALVSMAVMYATGSGVEQSAAKALEFYRRGADAGESHAYRGLALMTLRGEGRDPDPVEALALYEQGIDMGNDEEPKLREEIETAIVLAGGRVDTGKRVGKKSGASEP